MLVVSRKLVTESVYNSSMYFFFFLRSEFYERTNMAAADGPNIDERILLLS